MYMKHKNNSDDRFKVVRAGEVSQYYLSGEKHPIIKLDAGNVPTLLRHLIPLAEKWGIGDDYLRTKVVANASPDEITVLRQIISQHDDILDAWLAGPESASMIPSPEYLAFTHMRMAADGC
jgi:hypothetical protein